MKVTVKMCGLRSEDDVASLRNLPVQFAGFVLAPSKRKITINTLCKLKTLLPHCVTPVAVMVNPTQKEVDDVIDRAGVTTLQLHGDELPDWCRAVRKRHGSRIALIKALAARGKETVEQMATYGDVVDTFLIDTYQPDARGGTGKTFRWQDIPAYLEAAREVRKPLWIAGGLTPENVQQLLTRYRPDGVDVSSGVEKNGVKSAERMQQFVQRVRAI